MADQALDKLKGRARELTYRSSTRSKHMEVIAAELKESLLGWKDRGDCQRYLPWLWIPLCYAQTWGTELCGPVKFNPLNRRIHDP